MILNIFFDYIRCYLVPNCSNKISIFPKLSAPKLPLYFRVLLEYGACTDTLQHSYYPGNAVPWRKRQKNMHMIFRNLQRLYLKIVILCYLLKYLSYSVSYMTLQNPFPVFRSSYQMIFGIIYRMTGPLQFHAISLTYLYLPSAGELFIPVYKTGYSSSDFA